MITEIQVIQNSGVPIYHYNSIDDVGYTNESLLQASFIAAINQFALELKKGTVQRIELENQYYLLQKEELFTVIFLVPPKNESEYLNELKKVSNYLNEKIKNDNIINLDIYSNKSIEQLLNDFDEYLRENNLIKSEKKFENKFNKNQFLDLMYKSVGYVPGECNIGKTERMKRLIIGLIMLLISIVAYGVILLQGLSSSYIFLLILPNIGVFVGFYQYKAKFCIYNGFNEIYVME
ncbi:MAG: hypothetical protein OEY49_19140 [Candidatus Heimdallarchaeota archaeon]|nr:hypothetical protein [Candidatus Heimdallarchaeota archaeon]